MSQTSPQPPAPGPQDAGQDGVPGRQPHARGAAPGVASAASGQETASVRVRLDLAYDGAGFNGWAAQPGLRTVEGELSAALETVLRVPVRLTVAGRTDAGVHAAAQVAHLDVPAAAWQALPGRCHREPSQALLTRLAGVLARQSQVGGATTPRGAADVVVRAAQVVSPDFDARFSALRRRYVYRVCDRPELRDPGQRGRVLWLSQELDVEAMGASAQGLLGEHDFLSYCKPREGASTVRTLSTLRWQRAEGAGHAGLVTLTVVADAFCHSMVRSLVGAGLQVGLGRKAPDWPAQLLAARTRQGAAPVAPAHGLTLEEVTYPPPEQVGQQARRARVRRGGGC